MEKETNNDLLIRLAERVEQQEKQRIIQAIEYERRLTSLNGEAGRLREMQERYVPREVFDRVLDEIKKELKTAADYKTSQEGKGSMEKYIPWVIMAAALVYSFFKK